ncbi:hypothetical protein PoMZ_09076 [Pyricularia oryzae]|uniref:Uncharacterized protein n=1 Tax=Pyricularia oryzae TaxID=318829 RepID=A0A4P7MT44_PYROR|nr:hypothetical protein PoMZ_09076 [Pyricularia oryzae]
MLQIAGLPCGGIGTVGLRLYGYTKIKVQQLWTRGSGSPGGDGGRRLEIVAKGDVSPP